MSMINGLAGLIIWTDNLEVLLDFYRDVLQLVPHSEKTQTSFLSGGVILD
ncbi:MAG: hypothetical protein CM1200mP6_06580 [Anaerolineaceae bacterium]|nr:MAG: hypothetical protein CM1200mP6_06580 [Anaerolineaceae bacterium]